jgi:hypothetical protein
MIRLLAATAATLLAVAITSAPDASAGCDEDCAYEAQEAAYERAYERAYAREEAEEEGYYSPQRRSSSRSSRRRAQAERATKQAPQKYLAEPKPTAPSQSQPRTPRTRIASENSSIATGESDVAEDDSFGLAARREVGCKKFIASAGMTLSVPCE